MDKTTELHRGDIYYADLTPVIGSEQGGIRPVVILQNEIGNLNAPTVIVAAITAQTSKPKLPTHVLLTAEESGIKKDSIILLEQLRTIDKQRLRDKVGEVDMATLKGIQKGLIISLDLKDNHS